MANNRARTSVQNGNWSGRDCVPRTFNLDIDMRSVLEEFVDVVEVAICRGFPES